MKGIAGFARSIVRGQSRVPYPAARIIARIFGLQRLTSLRCLRKLCVELSTRAPRESKAPHVESRARGRNALAHKTATAGRARAASESYAFDAKAPQVRAGTRRRRVARRLPKTSRVRLKDA